MADERDKGAVQHLDANSKRLDKGAVEDSVASSASIVPHVMQLAS